MPLRLLDRYLLKQMLDYFLIGIVVFTLVFFFSDALLRHVREIQRYGVPFGTLMTLMGLQLPRSLAWILPASGFLAVLMVFNSLNNSFELIAMRMSGIALWRLAQPALMLGAFCSLLTYGINDYLVPWCNRTTGQMMAQAAKSGILPAGGRGFMYRTYDKNHRLMQLVYVSRYQGRRLQDSTIIDLSHPEMMQVLQSRSGTWDPADGWLLENVNMYVTTRDLEHSFAGHFGDFQVRGLLSRNPEEEEKQLEDLRRKQSGIELDAEQQDFLTMGSIIRKRENLGKRVARSNYLDWWEKLTWPLSSFALILNAVPLALSPPRQGGGRGFLFALGILALFYQLFAIFRNVGRIEALDFLGMGLPLPAYLGVLAWLPLLVMLLIGIALMKRKSYVL